MPPSYKNYRIHRIVTNGFLSLLFDGDQSIIQVDAFRIRFEDIIGISNFQR